MTSLTSTQKESFNDDGVLILPKFYSEEDCDSLRTRMGQMLDDYEPAGNGTVFSTTDHTHHDDDYFLTSGDKIRFFFEDSAVDNEGASLELSLNKVGHAMHDLDPVFSSFVRQPKLAELATDIGFVNPLLLQSMYIFKPPRIGGEVVWHTDHPFLWTDPPSVKGFWVALEDATIENGCMWCLPGLHKEEPRQRLKRTKTGAMEMETLDPAPFPTENKIPLEAKKGTVVVIDGLLPHWSGQNTSSRSRHAFTLHIIERSAHYPDDNWLQRSPEMPLRGFAD